MTNEPKTQNEETQQPNEPQTEQVDKLSIDKPSDFKFHAAYLAYSKTWDKVKSSNTKEEINAILVDLSKDKLEYGKFYKMLDEFRRQGSKHYEFSRQKIDTQRKRDWRQKQNRSQRNQRHGRRH